ncbi:MAG: phosphate ABC transporter substrate-binding protein [Armatimonadota bacterium]
MKIRSIWIISLVAAIVVLSGCGKQSAKQSSLEIKGSDTMVNLGQGWAEEFGKQHSGVNVSITGGGSGVGIAALINGDCAVAEASREMKAEELASAKAKGMNPTKFVVANDGVSVIVNPKSPVGKLTIAQLSDIYSGKIANWKALGGPDKAIAVLSRDKSSGTYDFFLEHVVRRGNSKGPEEFGKEVLLLPSNQAIADEVAGNEWGIGYVGMGYVDPAKHKALPVAKDADSSYVEPTPANVKNGSYPVARPLYLYTPNKPEGIAKAFVDFVLSAEGQKIVEKNEFVSVK